MNWQHIKDYVKQVVSNPYVKSPLIAVAILLAVVILFFGFLYVFSKHGRGFPVPNFTGLTFEKAHALAKQKRLRLEITDSVFILTRVPGSVIEQNPKPGIYVKANRRIFLTTNAINPILVPMPNLEGLTLRQAKSLLSLQGFELGYLSFTPDIAINNVLEQHYKGDLIAPGTQIPKGSTIDLLLGQGMNYEKTVLPRVIGLTFAEARNLLLDASLNIGKIVYDETVIDNLDSLKARAYSQYPNPFGDETQINFGAKVNLWFTINESRIPKDAMVEGEIKTPPAIKKEQAEEILE
jgi:beta-lactam-binding protein with PASTA domain